MRTGTSQVLFGFFAALFVASQANIVAHLGPVAGDLLSLQLTMSPETFRGILDGWTADELARYRSHFAWDSVHPLIYGTLLGLWTLVVHRQRPFSTRTLRLFIVLSLAPSVLDYIENAFHIYLEANRASINTGTVLLAGGAAGLKWTCAAVITTFLALTSVRALVGDRSDGSVATSRARGTGTAKTAAAKAGATRAVTGKANAAKALAGKPNTAKAEPGEAAASGSEPAKAGGAKAEANPEPVVAGSAKDTATDAAAAGKAAATSAGSKTDTDPAAAIPKQSSRKKSARRGGTGT